MSLFRRIRRSLQRPGDRRSLEADMQHEMSFHVEMEAAELIRQGVPEDDARRQAHGLGREGVVAVGALHGHAIVIGRQVHGIAKERRSFSPHLTVGRVKAPPGREFTQALSEATLDAGKTEVTKIIFMRSDLRPTGAVYTPLDQIKLGVTT